MSNTFEALLRERGGMRTRTTTRILPPRQKTSGPRDGRQLDLTQRAVGDRWYFNASPLAKFLYQKIEERFETTRQEHESQTDRMRLSKRKNDLMNEVKVILNEHRNLIVECVLPMFDVCERTSPGDKLLDGEELPTPDQHAHDYFLKNVFATYVRTLQAWLPEFVSADQIEASSETLDRLATLHGEKMANELRNYMFGFRRIVAPK